jgi:WD40 repeat protein
VGRGGPEWDHTARVWDAESGQELHRLEGHTGQVWLSAFSPDGKRLVTGSDHEALVWDAATFKEPRTVAVPAGWLAFAPDGKSVFSARTDDTAGFPHAVVRWDVATGERLGRVRLESPPGGWMSYALSPDGKTLYAGAHAPLPEAVVHVYDVATGKERNPVPPDAGSEVLAVAVSPDGTRLAAGSGGREGFAVRLYDLATGKLAGRYTGHLGRVRAVAFSPDGKLVASCDEAGWVRVCEAESGKLRWTVRGHRSAHCVAFTRDGTALFSGGGDNALRLWDVGSGRLLRVFGGRSAVAWLDSSPDGRLLAGAGPGKFLTVWDPGTGWQLLQAEAAEEPASVAFHPAGDRLAFGTANGTFGLLDLNTGKSGKTVKAHEGAIVSLAWRPDGRLLATSGGDDGTTRVWAPDEEADRSQTFPASGPGYGWAHGVAFTPEGRHLVTANPDGTVGVLRLARPGAVYRPADR